MRRVLLVCALCALSTVPLASASRGDTDGSLSVKRGRGTAVLKLNGTVIGRVRTGRVQIRDPRPFDDNDPQLRCSTRTRHPTLALSVCKGRNIGFRVDNGRFVVNIRGSGISISAVAHGVVTIDGAGDTGVADGVMSIDNGPYESLPDFATDFVIGTAPARS